MLTRSVGPGPRKQSWRHAFGNQNCHRIQLIHLHTIRVLHVHRAGFQVEVDEYGTWMMRDMRLDIRNHWKLSRVGREYSKTFRHVNIHMEITDLSKNKVYNTLKFDCLSYFIIIPVKMPFLCLNYLLLLVKKNSTRVSSAEPVTSPSSHSGRMFSRKIITASITWSLETGRFRMRPADGTSRGFLGGYYIYIYNIIWIFTNQPV